VVLSQSNRTGGSQLTSTTVGLLVALSYLLVSGALGYVLLHSHSVPDSSAPPPQIVTTLDPNIGNGAPVSSVPDSTATIVNNLSNAPSAVPDLSNDTQVSGPDNMTTDIPNGWTAVTYGDYVQAGDPNDSGRFVRYGATTAPTGDLLSSLTSAEQTNTSIQTGYQRLQLQSVSYHNSSDAVDWEFEYVKNGMTRHVESRWWVANGMEFWVYVSATADRWPDTAPIFGVMTATATP
jgi:hypothetical protein